MTRRLYRSRGDTILGGVAGGVAEYLDVDPSLVRIIWAILAIVTGGIFVVLYVVMWIVVPVDPGMPLDAGTHVAGEAPDGTTRHAPPRAYPRGAGDRSGNGTLIFGLILIGVGAWFLLQQLVDINMDRLWPVGLVILGALLLVVALRRPAE